MDNDSMNTGFHGDTLQHRERQFALIDQPLELYFELIGSRPSFDDSESARGYAAHWTIEDGWLFLEGMAARWSADQPMHMKDLFPFAGSKVFAAWYCGRVRGFRPDRGLPDMRDPLLARYPDLVLHIEHGRIATTSLIDRRVDFPATGASRQSARTDNVIDMAEYRRAGIHATWSDIMV